MSSHCIFCNKRLSKGDKFRSWTGYYHWSCRSDVMDFIVDKKEYYMQHIMNTELFRDLAEKREK